MKPVVLATDLDGTLIPLQDNPGNATDLHVLCKALDAAGLQLIFVTGRHLASVAEVMCSDNLPIPDWIIADVGTSIYQRTSFDDVTSPTQLSRAFVLTEAYAAELGGLVGNFSVQRVAELLAPIAALRMQESEKQSRFKLSYYVDHRLLEQVRVQIAERIETARAPYSIVASIDPFTQDGLIDLLPRQVTKAYGIEWWARFQKIERDEILYAGDSGNDSAVFAAGFRSIVVGNAQRAVLEAAEQAHRAAGWENRLYAAEQSATSGVLAGLQHFLLL